MVADFINEGNMNNQENGVNISAKILRAIEKGYLLILKDVDNSSLR